MKNNFKKYRLAKSLKQAEFAKILDIKPSTLSAIEGQSIKQVPLHIIEKLIEYDPDVDLNYILGHADESIEPRTKHYAEEIERQAAENEEHRERIEELERRIKIHLDLNNTLREMVDDLKEQAKKEDEED